MVDRRRQSVASGHVEGYSDSLGHSLAVRTRISHMRERAWRSFDTSMAFYLDNRDNILSRRFEFAHIDIKMVQLVTFGLVENDIGALAHGMYAAKIGGGVQYWVRWFCDRHFGNGGW